MNKLNRYISFALIETAILFFAGNAYAAEYFVSNSGNDTASGTISTPFKTIDNGVSMLKPGDKLFVRGGTYPGFSAKVSGTATAPVTISGYNNEYPKISGGSPVKTYQKSYIVINGFEVTGALTAAGIRADQSSFITISNNKVHDNLANGLNGITILSSSNVKVLNNTVYNNYTSGISIYGSASINTEIAGNTVYGHHLAAGNSDGINCSSTTNAYIHHNNVSDNSDDGIDTWSCQHNTIAYNIVSKSGGTGDGNGIKSGGMPTGGFNLVIGNISYNNMVDGITSNGSGGNKYYNNTAYGNGKDGFSDGWRNNNLADGTVFINNIGYGNTRADVSMSKNMVSVSHNNFWGKPMWNYTPVTSLATFYTNSGFDNPNAGVQSSYSGNPLFVNSSIADFNLQPASPLINKGDSTNPGNVVTTGIVDIGAKEFTGTVVTPTATPTITPKPTATITPKPTPTICKRGRHCRN